jgi:hypothetical protein
MHAYTFHMHIYIYIYIYIYTYIYIHTHTHTHNIHTHTLTWWFTQAGSDKVGEVKVSVGGSDVSLQIGTHVIFTIAAIKNSTASS